MCIGSAEDIVTEFKFEDMYGPNLWRDEFRNALALCESAGFFDAYFVRDSKDSVEGGLFVVIERMRAEHIAIELQKWAYLPEAGFDHHAATMEACTLASDTDSLEFIARVFNGEGHAVVVDRGREYAPATCYVIRLGA